MTIGGKIKELREAANLTLNEVSELTGIDSSLLAKYEENEIKPHYTTARKITKIITDNSNKTFNEDTDTTNCITATEELFGIDNSDNAPPVDEVVAAFAEQLKYLREVGDLTRKELADDLGISEDEIIKLEREECVPDIITLDKIADYFDTPADYLLGKSLSSDNKRFFSFVKHLEAVTDLYIDGIITEELYRAIRDDIKYSYI